ncbi:SRPBCC family protein [Tenacibaculum caenipelagi]|uniref:Polyketide cyclase/dehydrase/lipid transport protein n=1 Tax=Tenacibaculum caenipelagi TaxID=1325435 RepID=A0A4V3D341_9FLAO|nr:SRPBCC family protein [Tenacibaculum caenipelagi]TDQ27694.1 polyketide cyclase/dehydrase/lipid transport protein [Tenacibaculum caenipelagi]
MKTIKIILGIITALILTFFLTGLVIQEVIYTNEVQINKPVNEVFADFQNVELMKQWMPEMKSIETLEEKPEKVGSTYKVVVENQGRLVTMTEKVLAYNPNKRITFHFDAESILKTDDYVFSSEGNSTKIIQTTTSTSESYIMSCLLPYFKRKPRRISQQYLEQFKKASEAHN